MAGCHDKRDAGAFPLVSFFTRELKSGTKNISYYCSFQNYCWIFRTLLKVNLTFVITCCSFCNLAKREQPTLRSRCYYVGAGAVVVAVAVAVAVVA